jgi:hypothetical protein
MIPACCTERYLVGEKERGLRYLFGIPCRQLYTGGIRILDVNKPEPNKKRKSAGLADYLKAWKL